jgi:putative tricarboxylic transport membrane protein
MEEPVGVIRHPKDFWAGVLFIALGGSAFYIALDYTMGTAARMGPGYFPRVVGGMLAVLGASLVLRSFRLQGEKIAFPSFKPVIIILAAVLLFGVTLATAGLVISTILLVLLASVASHEYRRIESVIAAVVLAAFVVGAFHYGLDLQIDILPPTLFG